MASREQVIRSYEFIRRAYAPRVAVADVETLKVWRDLLEGIPDDRVESAVFEACKTSKHPPAPSEIIATVRVLFPPRPAAHHEFEFDDSAERGGDPERIRSLLDQARHTLARGKAS